MKINKTGYTLAALLLVQQGFAQTVKPGQQFILKGHLNEVHVDSVLLSYGDGAGKYKQLSTPVLNDSFTFSGEISKPAAAYISFKNTGEVIPPQDQMERMKQIFLEPSELTLSGNPSNLAELKLTGSKAQQELDEMMQDTNPILEEMKPLSEAFRKEKDHEKAAALHDQFEPYFDRIKKANYQFFIKHPNSYVTLDQMKYYVSRFGLDSVKTIYNNFNAELKGTAEGKTLFAEIKKIEGGMPGSIAGVFAGQDINGKPLSLTDFKGKYVILDFWASWCVPCRKGNPHMIEVYNKYKNDKFDIIGIASDDGAIAAWKGAVAKDQIGIWHHILSGYSQDLRLKGIPNPKDIGDQYAISSIPTKILIDPSGKIIGRYGDAFGGSDEDMDKMLASIFNK